jgi:hypothetical protein
MVLYAKRKVFVGLKFCFLEFSNFLFIEIWGVTRTSALLCKTSSCSPQTPELISSKLHSVTIVDATAPFDQAQHAGIINGRRGSRNRGVGKVQDFHPGHQSAEEAGNQQEAQGAELP